MSLSLQVEMSGLDDVLAEFNALPEQIAKATKRAQTKARDYAAMRLAHVVAEAYDLPAAKYRTVRVKTGSGGVVWAGYNPMAAAYMGKLVQEDDGAWAGQYWFPGGFVATMRSGHAGIFKRAAQLTHWSAGRPRKWKPNLPIEEQGVQLTNVPELAAGLQPEIGERFAELLRQELNFEINVRGGP